MTDRREQILQRLEVILQRLAPTGSGINVYRDRAELEDNELPAYVVLDGNETKLPGVPAQSRSVAQIMLLTPQIFWVPVPPNNVLNVGIGPNLSGQRVTLLSAIMGDSVLADLYGPNGYIEYRGMETDMNTGAEVKGQFRLDLAIAYPLNFTKL